ncbi:unnamed protein product [Cunninghamella blakesleeana]
MIKEKVKIKKLGPIILMISVLVYVSTAAVTDTTVNNGVEGCFKMCRSKRPSCGEHQYPKRFGRCWTCCHRTRN